MSNLASTQNGAVATQDGHVDLRIHAQNFLKKLNQDPKPESLGKTSDGNALTVAISHVQMTLDEYFFGLWSDENFRWERILNEIVGAIDLTVIHPVTGKEIKRTGAAAIQIMVDAVPEDVKRDKRLKNAWALNLENKKSNSLDMGFPKLKAECQKNAAQTLGKIFGRDLNRAIKDDYQPIIKTDKEKENERLYKLIMSATTAEDLTNCQPDIDHHLYPMWNDKMNQLENTTA